MAYNGYLIKILGNGDYTIPLTLINEVSYKGTLSVMDLDATRTADGILHRNVVLAVSHCSFETRPLNNTDVASLWGNIRSRYTNAAEKKVYASVYISELDDYMSANFYIPDIEMTISHIENNKVFYEPITFEFIGYGD